MKALIEAGDLRLVDEDVLLDYWFNEYEIGIKLNGHGRQGHGSIMYVIVTLDLTLARTPASRAKQAHVVNVLMRAHTTPYTCARHINRNFYTGAKTIDQVRAFQVGRDYPGNAPPMRALPLGTDHLLERRVL
jgi:hypothetical protein